MPSRSRKRTPPPTSLVRDNYNQQAERYDSLTRGRRELRFARIDEPILASTEGAGLALEIGCGTGRVLAQSRARRTVGIDLSEGMARVAARKGFFLARADGHQLPFQDQVFDAIIAGDGVFRYLDYPLALAEASRVLKPGGSLAVHQYALETLSLRRSPISNWHLGHPQEMAEPAAAVGLELQAAHRFRSIRFAPYALPIPSWMPGPLWSHCVLVFRKR